MTPVVTYSPPRRRPALTPFVWDPASRGLWLSTDAQYMSDGVTIMRRVKSRAAGGVEHLGVDKTIAKYTAKERIEVRPVSIATVAPDALPRWEQARARHLIRFSEPHPLIINRERLDYITAGRAAVSFWRPVLKGAGKSAEVPLIITDQIGDQLVGLLMPLKLETPVEWIPL